MYEELLTYIVLLSSVIIYTTEPKHKAVYIK